MHTIIGNSWDDIFKNEYKMAYYESMQKFLDKEYKEKTVFPPRDKIFEAFRYVNYNDVKVVILGQDPYHGDGQAMGLAFSVSNGIALPPTLTNIYKEIESDLQNKVKRNGSLVGWAKQGVLLLNTVLTVRKGEPNSHAHIGWQDFISFAIKSLNDSKQPIVYILWGNGAISKKSLIFGSHLVIESPHPSPLSAYRGFFGSKPFSKANDFLVKNHRTPIDWSNTDDIHM